MPLYYTQVPAALQVKFSLCLFAFLRGGRPLDHVQLLAPSLVTFPWAT